MKTKDVTVTGSAVESSSMRFLVDAMLGVEKLRVRTQVRRSHLARQNRIDKDTDMLLEELVALEKKIDGRVAEEIQYHPASPWFSRVKGIGKENIAKVVGFIRIKPGDEFVCHNRECQNRLDKEVVAKEAPLCPQCGDQMYDPPYADTISALWKYAGYAVVNGKAEKRERGGGKLEYNSQLRTMCWRVATSLMKGGGKFYEVYVNEKTKLLSRYKSEGIKVVPTSALPKKNGKKYEPEGVISEGHVHNQALRKMMKLFLSCLWQVWREAEGLPTRNPWVLEYLPEHTHFINAWEMVDKEEKKVRKTRTKKVS